MRNAVRTAAPHLAMADLATNSHAGLYYERYGTPSLEPGPDIGRIPTGANGGGARQAFLDAVVELRATAAYTQAFARWRGSLAESHAMVCEVEATRRVLIGHGTPSPVEVGLTLHHTWGVPVLPGSAQKGLLNHMLDNHGRTGDPATDATAWRGVGYDDAGRPVAAPGEYHGALFGYPALANRADLGQRGSAVFEDALYVPGSVKDDAFLCLDVLTPHQVTYYRNQGRPPPEGPAGPLDWDDPNPVAFVAVRPGARFLVAVTPLAGRTRAAELGIQLLLEALRLEGLGSKTAAGYGRFRAIGRPRRLQPTPSQVPPGAPAAPSAPPVSLALQGVIDAVNHVLTPADGAAGQSVAERFNDRFGDAAVAALIEPLPDRDRPAAAREVGRLLKHRGVKKSFGDQLRALRATLIGEA